MEYTIHALAKLAGISTRTLRYYDEIGLLRPCRTTGAGYRIYGQAEVDLLQQILFYRALKFPLEEIRQIVHAPDFDRLTALCAQRDRLRAEYTQLSRLLASIEATIQHEQGGYHMSDFEKFEAFKQNAVAQNEAAHGSEVRAKYGDAAMDAANARVLSMTAAEYQNFEALGQTVLSALADAVRSQANPHGDAGKRIYDLHRRWLSYSLADCTAEMHQSIASMYVADERFAAYYDRETPGCAKFLCEAVAYWASRL